MQYNVEDKKEVVFKGVVMSKGSYITTEFTEDILGEIKRLGLQVELFWPEEKKIYESISLPESGRILEVGSGPGFYSNHLSEFYKSASVTSFEYDSSFVDFHRDYLRKNEIQSIDVIQGDVLGYNMESLGQYDLVVSRMVLEHLPEPENIFRKLLSMVKLGGHIVILDNDFSNHLRTVPDIPELDTLYNAYCLARKEEGGNPYIGRQLPYMFENEELDEIRFRTITAHSYKIDKSLFLGAESSGIGLSLVKKGYLDNSVFQNLIINWSKMAQSEDNVMIRELYGCIGKKLQSGVAAHKGTKTEFTGSDVNTKANIEAPLKITPPRSSIEKDLVEIWSGLMANRNIGINNSFFHLGGESFQIPLMIMEIKNKLNVELMITDVFEYPTIKELAAYIGSVSDISSDVIIENQREVKNPTFGNKNSNNPFARLKKD